MLAQSELSDFSREDLSSVLKDAADIDRLLGFAPLLVGARHPESRQSLRHLDSNLDAVALSSTMPAAAAASILFAWRRKQEALRSKARSSSSAETWHDLLDIVDRLGGTDRHFESALFGPELTTALDLELRVIGSTNANTGEWFAGLSVAAAGPFPQGANGETVVSLACL